EELVQQFDLAWGEELYRLAQTQFPDLPYFDGAGHERQIARFRELDAQRQLLARQEVALRPWERLPRGEVGAMGLVRREINKKRRHLPLRRLFQEAGGAIQQIKPVFLMSPLSVAQFLEPGAVEFDLLVIDEASQVRPVEALGAIARAHQMVVVGDDRQLPPTHFFTRLLADDGTEEAEAA
ncbi:MAG: AAA domain-containing protein, partial [Planctomycetota bacterium]|nr:AAA domain-containing protein [Planctomycetota bacterium]